MTAEHPIIALWAHPRSMSTAIERVMRERGDLCCLHEPFMHDYYLHRAGRSFPMYRRAPGQPASFDDVRNDLLERARRGPVFFKDMAYYVWPRMADDVLAGRLTHAFLIRDPRAAILSYHRLDPDLTCEEVGLEAQWRLFEALRSQGHRPVILRSEAVRADPRGILGDWWKRIGLSPAVHAFQWDDAVPGDWQHVKGWHGAVLASGAIRPPRETETEAALQARFDAAAAEAPHLADYLAHHVPFWKRLAEAAEDR